MPNEIYLDTLDLSSTDAGWGGRESVPPPSVTPVKLNGLEIHRGIRTHAGSCLRFALEGRGSRFQAIVGVDQSAPVWYPAHRFKVVGDGLTLWQGPGMRPGNEAVEVDVALEGVCLLELVVEDTSGLDAPDLVVWGDARVSVAGEAPRVLTNPEISLEGKHHEWSFRVRGKRVFLQRFGLKFVLPGTAWGQPIYPTQWDFPARENAISLIQADGNLSLDLEYKSHRLIEEENGKTGVVFLLSDPLYPVEVECHYQLHRGTDVMETWTVVRNSGQSQVVVDRARSIYLEIEARDPHLTCFTGSWGAEALMSESPVGIGVREIRSRTGTRTAQPAHPGFVLATDGPACEESGEVLLGCIAWSGNWSLTLERGHSPKVVLTAGYDPHLSRYPLAPGETLETPRVVLAWSDRGKGDASRRLHRWARTGGLRGGDEPRRVLLNSWEGAYFTFDAPLIKRMISDAADMGIELFVLDDGWFGRKHPRNGSAAGLGDWMENTEKLEGGIEALLDHAERENIDFGIWVEPEMINPVSELYETHPEWVIQLPGRMQRQQRNQLGLDLSNPAVQDFIIGFMDDLLDRHPRIRFVKWDCNRVISDPGSIHLGAHQQERLWIDYVRGYYRTLEVITQKHPAVTFQVCGSGGGRTDYGSMTYHHEFWTSDNTDALERIRMQWSFGHFFPALSIAAHVTEVPNHQTGRVTPIKYRFDVAMTGRLGFELRPERVPAEDLEFSRLALAVYKQIRPIVQFGDLYRLSSPCGNSVAALMYLQEGCGVFFALLLGLCFLREAPERAIAARTLLSAGGP
jgi:alpha-galactosidase